MESFVGKDDRFKMEETMGEMELREIVVRAGWSIRTQCRKSIPFLLSIYLPFAVMSCVLILDIFHAISDSTSQAISASGRNPGIPNQGQAGYPQPLTPDQSKALLHNLVKNHKYLFTVLYLAWLVNFYLVQSATILLFGYPFQSELHNPKEPPFQWTQKTMLQQSVDRAWRMFLTDFLASSILVLMVTLMCAAAAILYLVVTGWITGNAIILWDLFTLELFVCVVLVLHFVLNISLIRPVVVMEREWGVAALRRSARLVRGRRLTAIMVFIFQLVAFKVAQILQTAFVIGPTWSRPLGFVANVGLMTFVDVLLTTVSTVFYFTCRARYSDAGLDLATFVTQFQPLASQTV